MDSDLNNCTFLVPDRDGWYRHSQSSVMPSEAEEFVQIHLQSPRKLNGMWSRVATMPAADVNWTTVRKWRQAPAETIAAAAAPDGIGDIDSDEVGTGARYNAGKPPFELIPLRMLAASFPAYEPATVALKNLGRWQEGGTRQDLMNALSALGGAGWEECAQVFDYGRAKYAAWNWAKGMPWSVPLACAVRHLRAMLAGEDTDSESGWSHRGHVFCNVVMLWTYHDSYPSGDDRPPAHLFLAKAKP